MHDVHVFSEINDEDCHHNHDHEHDDKKIPDDHYVGQNNDQCCVKEVLYVKVFLPYEKVSLNVKHVFLNPVNTLLFQEKINYLYTFQPTSFFLQKPPGSKIHILNQVILI